MRKNRIWKRVLTGVFAASMILGSAGGTMANAEEASDNGMVRSFLTGKLVPETIGRKKAISVMFNNIQAALPQSFQMPRWYMKLR